MIGSKREEVIGDEENCVMRSSSMVCTLHSITFFISIPLIPYSYGVEFLIFLWICTQSVGLLGRVTAHRKAST
jgi:accessory gene regulator protein AgrB